MPRITWVAIMTMGLLLLPALHAAEKTPAPVKTIPLASIYATNGQEGIPQVGRGPFAGQAIPLAMAFGWAKDFKGLTKESLTAATAGQELTLSQAADGVLWVAIHLGTSGGDPPQYLVDSITVPKDGLIEVSYHPTHAVPMTKDVHEYRVWIPLGRLASGAYVLRILNAGQVAAEQKIALRPQSNTP